MPGDRITYVGHATALLEIAGVRLLTDPLLRQRLLLGGARRLASPVAFETYERIDAVLISHAHADHLDFPSLRLVGKEALVFAPPGAARVLRRRGYRAVTELTPGATARVGELELTVTPAAHNGHRWKLGRWPALAAGYVIAGGGRRVYFAGDTDLFAGMGALAGELDAALLPIGGWGPSVGRGHLDPARAAEAAAMLRPRFVVPIHWGTLLRADLIRSSAERLEQPGIEFAAQMARRAPRTEAVVLSAGESLELGSA